MTKVLMLKYYTKLVSRQINDDLLIHKLLKDVEPINIGDADTLFAFSQRGMGFYRKLYILIAHALSKRGYPSIFLFKDNFLSQYTPQNSNFLSRIGEKINVFFKNFDISSYFPRLIIDGKELSNSLVEEVSKIRITDKQEGKLRYDWDIDLEKKIISTNELNFSPLIHNTLRAIFKRYNIDFEDKEILCITKDMILTCDLLFYYFNLLKKHASENKKKIRIVGWETNYLPNSAFLFLCNSLSNDRDIEYIDLSRGYNQYFGYNIRESNIVSSNLTRSGKENRFVVDNNELRSVAEEYDADRTFSEIKNIIKKPITKDFKPEQKEVIKLVRKYKSLGKNVFCLFTHLFYDTPLDDSSSSFKDMCEWLLETIDFFKKTDDFLLLKPHPVEIRPEYPEKEPNETLSSFLKSHNIYLSHNIFLLEPRLFSLNEIVIFVDCGLVWRASVALELPFYNVPSIIAGSPPYKILDFNYAKNKKDYFYIIKNIDKLDICDDLKLNVARYLLAMKKNHVYVNSIAYDKKIKKNYLEKNLIDKYIKDGDKNIDFLVNEVLK